MKDISIDRFKLEDKELIVIAFFGIPDESLRSQCINKFQEEHFKSVTEYFVTVGTGIYNYFSGKPIFELSDDTFSPIEVDFIKTEIKMWIAFYALLQWGWSYIKSELENSGFKDIEYCTPGHLFIHIIKNIAASDFLVAKSNHFELIARKRYKELVNKNKKAVLFENKKGDKEIEGEYKFANDFNIIYHLCLGILNKNKNNPDIKDEHKEYMRLVGELERLEKKRLHPRNRPLSWRIINEELQGNFLTCP